MRQAMKFMHTLSSCGIIGALVAYMVLLTRAPQATAAQYSDVRQTIDALCDLVLLPSLGLALVTGLLAMAVHRPYQDKRWAWVKAATGIGMFEATLGIINAKSDYAAKISLKIASGEAPPDALQQALANEWTTLWAIMAISIANIVLGVWRPKLQMKWATG